MEQSPLTHQPRPEVFQQKIVRLYEALFKDEDESEKSEGFWAEFFLLRPERASLRRILDEIGPEDLLELGLQTRQLFFRAVVALKSGHGVADLHALDTLSTFFIAILGKRYTNPSSDIISVLAGLDHIDAVFTDFVGALDAIVRNGRSLILRQKAIEVALAVTSGAYQTTLLTYFIQRDLFPAVMKFIQDAESPDMICEPFTLLGLLANYNKFEFQNPYQMRLNDFVNEATIQKIIRSVGYACQKLRAGYVEIQDDIPEGWTLASTLNMIGLRAIAPGAKPAPKAAPDAETAKQMFAELPGPEAAILLATYDFTHANKLFCFNLVTLPAEKGEEQAFAGFVSLTSYLLQHAHLSQRATLYCHLNLMVFRLLVEDPVLCRRMCGEESKTAVRLCRQRQPYLPLVRTEQRVVATAVMDAMIDGISHNLRRRLDVGLYTLCVGILLRITSHLSRSRTRLHYHWAELFRALLTLVRFLVSYAADLQSLPHVDTLLDHVVNLLALGLSAGEAFLPTPAAYDDLFYKVVESGDVLVKFRDTYRLANRPSNSIDTLVNVSTHYKQMLVDGKGSSAGGGSSARTSTSTSTTSNGDHHHNEKAPPTVPATANGKRTAGGGGGSNLTSLQVAEVIKQGYETLSIQAKEGLDSWERFREADERTLLKKMARAAVADVRVLVAE